MTNANGQLEVHETAPAGGGCACHGGECAGGGHDSGALLLDGNATARALGIGLSLLYNLDRSGELGPTGLKLRGRRLWPRRELADRRNVSTNSRYLHDVEFAAVQVHRSTGYTHPGMVLLDLGVVPNEQIAGGVTELSVETTGKVVQDESGAFAVSRYHADAIRDILTQPVIEGDGSGTPYSASYYRGVSSARLTGDGWADQKDLADTLVPDGNGNNVEMLRFDAVFDGAGSMFNAIGQVTVGGRCGVRYLGRDFGLWVDTPRDPCGLLCDGNWAADSAELTPVPAGDLASEASVRYRDADSGHAERSILVIDHDSTTLSAVDLVGTTRTHEAARLARRELARNRLVDLAMTCLCDIDAMVYEPGDVVYCQIDGRSIGDRVTAVDATSLTVLRSVSDLVTGDDVILVQIRDAVTGVQSLEIQEVVSVSDDGKTVTVASWDTRPAVGDVTLFGPADLLDDDQFEIVEAGVDENLHVDLSLIKYAPVLDDLDAIAPSVYVPLASLQRIDQYGGVVRSPIPGVVIDRIGERGAVVFEWGRYMFAANDPGAGSISWATETDDDGDDSGYVTYLGTLYAPADGNTSDTYVYWDPASRRCFATTGSAPTTGASAAFAPPGGSTATTGWPTRRVRCRTTSSSTRRENDGIHT